METDKKSNTAPVIIIFAAALVRLIYILNTTVYERGHDVGNYTSLGDKLVNPGHLGYIEYLAKFRHLPDFNPFKLFSYYHPPLHHFLASLMVRISAYFGADTDTAFESIQLLTLTYSVAALITAYFILKEIFGKGVLLNILLAVFSFHPSMIYMAGSINNDMLTVLFELLIIYFSLIWIKNRGPKELILIGAIIGLGMCVKISVVIMALPVGLIMLMNLTDTVKKGVRKDTLRCIGNYALFGIISLALGLSWTIRNAVVFGEKPGISSTTPESHLYMGNYSLIQRLGFPKSLGLAYPFHSEYGKASDNVWLILFRTSIFSEIRPDVKGITLFLCQSAFLINCVIGIVCAVLTIVMSIYEIKRGSRYVGAFLLSGYLTFILTYVAFVIKYPYTCSCDFRYIVPTLLYGLVALGQFVSAIRRTSD